MNSNLNKTVVKFQENIDNSLLTDNITCLPEALYQSSLFRTSLIRGRLTPATPESRTWRIVFRPPVGAVLTFENNSIDFWQPLPRLWRGAPCMKPFIRLHGPLKGTSNRP